MKTQLLDVRIRAVATTWEIQLSGFVRWCAFATQWKTHPVGFSMFVFLQEKKRRCGMFCFLAFALNTLELPRRGVPCFVFSMTKKCLWDFPVFMFWSKMAR